MTYPGCLGFEFDAVSGRIHGYGATDTQRNAPGASTAPAVGVP